MSTTQHNLVLILARGLASAIATPMFLVDENGTLVYFNEAAEEILGQPYADAAELPQEEWATMFSPKDPDSGEALDASEVPLSRAIRERQATHRSLSITGLDGIERRIGVTAFPLFAREHELVGAAAIFWQEDRS